MKRQLSPSRRDDDAVFVKDVVDKASKNPLFAAFLQNSTLELAKLPAEVIANEIILRSLPRFVQLMLINKTLRKEIESIKNLYYTLFKYHFPESCALVYDHVRNAKFYDNSLYFYVEGEAGFRSQNPEEQKEMVVQSLEEVLGLSRFNETVNLLDVLMIRPLKKKEINYDSLFYDRHAEEDCIRLCYQDTEMAHLVNRLFASMTPFGAPHPSYYMASHAHLRHEIVMPLIDQMNNILDERLEPYILYMFITTMNTIAKQNRAIIRQNNERYRYPSSVNVKQEIREILKECTEVTAEYLISFLSGPFFSRRVSMINEIADYIRDTTIPLLNDMVADNDMKSIYFVDTITAEKFGTLFVDLFKTYVYHENVPDDYWQTELDHIKGKLADLRTITFNKESIESIEKTEILLDRVKEDGIDEWIESKEEKGVKENDLFRRLFYRALKKDGIDVARSISRDSSLFGSYCHACPMEAIYEEGGTETPRLFCSHECLKMTMESDINRLFLS